MDSLPAQRAYMAIPLPQYRIVSPIFAARAVSTAGGDGYVIGTAEDCELRGFDHHIVVLARDDLGVEHVRVHPILRRTEGG